MTSTNASGRPASPSIDEPLISWPGHATVSIQLDGVNLLTDPLLRPSLGPIRRRCGRIDTDSLERPDAVLISHLHHDHLDLPSLHLFGTDAPLLVPQGVGALLYARGRLLTSTRADACGYLVEGSRSVYFAGHTDRFAAMSELRGGIDLTQLNHAIEIAQNVQRHAGVPDGESAPCW